MGGLLRVGHRSAGAYNPNAIGGGPMLAAQQVEIVDADLNMIRLSLNVIFLCCAQSSSKKIIFFFFVFRREFCSICFSPACWRHSLARTTTQATCRRTDATRICIRFWKMQYEKKRCIVLLCVCFFVFRMNRIDIECNAGAVLAAANLLWSKVLGEKTKL